MTQRQRLGVVMDPIGDIKYAKDSTLAMLLAAQARGFELAYLEMHDLLLRDGVALGRVRPLTVAADPKSWFTLGEPRVEPLGDLDCILMRKDPPFDTEYIYSTYILERAAEQGALVVNRPQGLRGHEREGIHRLVPAMLCAYSDYARYGRNGRVSARAWADRLQTTRRHGGTLHFCARTQ